MHADRLNENSLCNLLCSATIDCPLSFHPFKEFRQGISGLTESEKAEFLSMSRALVAEYTFPALSASAYLRFSKDGNRTAFQDVYFKKRQSLLTLLIAECIAQQEEFVPLLADGVWSVCEESSWVIPPHNRSAPDSQVRNPLPDVTQNPPMIDLFSAETASLLCWVLYFAQEKLNRISPLLCERIRYEIRRRVLTPFLATEAYPWMGLGRNLCMPVNNWNPWICSNVLTAFLQIETNIDIQKKGIEKLLQCVSRFAAFYPLDGGCDEGPGYFTAAAASLVDFLNQLEDATQGEVSFYHHEHLRNMVSYIYKVYLGNGYYVNFADAAPKVNPPADLLIRFGTKVQDSAIIAFGHMLEQTQSRTQIPRYGNYYRYFHCLCARRQEQRASAAKLQSHYLSGIQVMIARTDDSEIGFTVAAKGGNNAESHNHNDVGNFVLFHNQKPVLIDAGVEAYTKKTFGEDRYSIWTMQSCYHNLPTINGYEQHAGRADCPQETAAQNVVYTCDAFGQSLVMDLKQAYPTQAQIKTYQRNICLRHRHLLVVTDCYELKEYTQPLQMHLLCYHKPEVRANGIALGQETWLKGVSPTFTATVEEIALSDEKIKRDWDKAFLYRLTLTQTAPIKKSTIGLTFVSELSE